MLALRVTADSLLQDLVGSLMAVIGALRFHRVRDTVCHAVSSSHDGRVEGEETLSG